MVVKHIVFWRLHEQANGNDKAFNMQLIKEKLEALNGKIPGVIKIEVGFDFLKSDFSADLALYSEFESHEALQEYQNYPEHIEIKNLIMELSSERLVFDYEI